MKGPAGIETISSGTGSSWEAPSGLSGTDGAESVESTEEVSKGVSVVPRRIPMMGIAAKARTAKRNRTLNLVSSMPVTEPRGYHSPPYHRSHNETRSQYPSARLLRQIVWIVAHYARFLAMTLRAQLSNPHVPALWGHDRAPSRSNVHRMNPQPIPRHFLSYHRFHRGFGPIRKIQEARDTDIRLHFHPDWRWRGRSAPCRPRRISAFPRHDLPFPIPLLSEDAFRPIYNRLPPHPTTCSSPQTQAEAVWIDRLRTLRSWGADAWSFWQTGRIPLATLLSCRDKRP